MWERIRNSEMTYVEPPHSPAWYISPFGLRCISTHREVSAGLCLSRVVLSGCNQEAVCIKFPATVATCSFIFSLQPSEVVARIFKRTASNVSSTPSATSSFLPLIGSWDINRHVYPSRDWFTCFTYKVNAAPRDPEEASCYPFFFPPGSHFSIRKIGKLTRNRHNPSLDKMLSRKHLFLFTAFNMQPQKGCLLFWTAHSIYCTGRWLHLTHAGSHAPIKPQ